MTKDFAHNSRTAKPTKEQRITIIIHAVGFRAIVAATLLLIGILSYNEYPVVGGIAALSGALIGVIYTLPGVVDLLSFRVSMRKGIAIKSTLDLKSRHYYVEIAELTLEAKSEDWYAIEDEAYYVVYYARFSKWLLSYNRQNF